MPFIKTFLIKKKGNVELIENELLQIIKLFNFIQLILNFTSLKHFTKRVNKSDEFFYET